MGTSLKQEKKIKMAKDKDTVVVNFQFERSTKGAHRFQEVDDKGKVLTTNDDAVVGTLYLRKSGVGDKEPKNAKVTIELTR